MGGVSNNINKAMGALAGGACLLILLWFAIFHAAFIILAWWTWGMYEAPGIAKIAAIFFAYILLGSLVARVRSSE